MLEHEQSELELVNRTIQCMNEHFSPFGFELAPFLVGWYNDIVSQRLKLDTITAPFEDCVALCIISSPHMFEDSFLCHLSDWFKKDGITSLADALRSLKPKSNGFVVLPGPNDPLDWSVFLRVHEAMNSSFSELQGQLAPEDYHKLIIPRFIPDYAMKPVVRLPYIHVQCAGHISGLAYFHHTDPSPSHATGVGCSLHARYGGWFGFRGAIVFPNLRCPTLPKSLPVSSLPPGRPPFAPELITRLLDCYKNHWRENQWRDFGLPENANNLYSPAARCFFNTPPAQRAALLEGWVNGTGDIDPFSFSAR